MNSILSTVEIFCNSLSIQPGDKILAAVSGGADSVAMLHLLSHSTIYNRQSTIISAHINHHLRGTESDKDQDFVTRLCADWNIPCITESVDVKAYAAKEKLSIETAARILRLESLERIAQQTGCTYIATAHHKDDQAETVLFRLLRGTAFAGLAGIRPVRPHHGLCWIRPMLNIRKSQIEAYCKENNIPWCNDATNVQTHYRRNWIRHKLVPHLQEQSTTDLTEKLAALAQSALKLQNQIESSAEFILQSKIENQKSKMEFSAALIQQSGPFTAGEILRAVLTHLGCGLRDITLSHYQKFFQLLDKSRGTLQLPAGCTLRKNNDLLAFKKTGDSYLFSQSKIENPQSSIILPIPGTIQWNNWSIQTRILQITQQHLDAFQKQNDPLTQWFDLRQLQSPLIARHRQDHDTFTPFGRKTQKRIARFLTDSQIDETLRESCFIIEDKIGILWLAPVRRSALAPVTDDIVDVLEVRIEKM